MADVALTLKTALESSTVLPIYVGVVPATVDEAIGIRLNDGASPSTFFGQTDTVQYGVVQILIRSKEYLAGFTDAEAIVDKLNRYVNTANNILGVVQLGSIMHLGRDNNNLHEFQLNFQVIT